MGIVNAAAALLLLIALWTDLRNRKIPNVLTVSFFAAGAIYHTVTAGAGGFAIAMAGAVSGFGPLLLLYAARGIGAGDVKLFGAVGAWIGVVGVLQLMMYSMLFAGFIGAALLIIERTFSGSAAAAFIARTVPVAIADAGRKPKRLSSGRTFPFMLAVAPAAAMLWLVPA